MRCAVRPPSETPVWLFVASETLTKFWPARQIEFDSDNQSAGTVGLGPKPPDGPIEEMKIIVGLVGESGNITCNYYLASNPERRPSLPKLPDLVLCDTRTVAKKDEAVNISR